MMTTLGKAVDSKLYDFIEELVERYAIDNERYVIPIVNEKFTATIEDGTKITGTLNGCINIDDWYYDRNDDCEHYCIDMDHMYIHCKFQYTTDKGEYYLERINNF